MGEPTARIGALLDELTSLESAHADIALVTGDDVHAVVTIDTDARSALLALADAHNMTLEPVNRYGCYLDDGTGTPEGSLEVITRDNPTSRDTAIAVARLLLAYDDALHADSASATGSLSTLVTADPKAAETLGTHLLATALTLLLDGEYGSGLTGTSPLETTLATLIQDTAIIDPWHAATAQTAAEAIIAVAPLVDTARALTR